MFGKKTVLRLRKENFKIQKLVLLPCIALGLAPFAMQATESILVLCFNSSLLKYGGDLAVGAMTILSSIMQFALLPLQGLTQGGNQLSVITMVQNQVVVLKRRLNYKLFHVLLIVRFYGYLLCLCHLYLLESLQMIHNYQN